MISDLAVPRLRVTAEESQRVRVSYHGRCHAPAEGTYEGLDPLRITYATLADSGAHMDTPGDLRSLYPLIAAAIYEVSFCAEAGPLLTWLN